ACGVVPPPRIEGRWDRGDRPERRCARNRCAVWPRPGRVAPLPAGHDLHRFFFQAEDGIRDFHVTGVQTCALPISVRSASSDAPRRASGSSRWTAGTRRSWPWRESPRARATTRDETPPERGPLSPAPRGTAAPGPVPRRTCMRPVAFVALGFLLVACQSSIDSRLEEARELVFRQRPEEAIAAYRSLLYALEGQNDERAQKARIEALSRIGDLSYLEKRDIQGAAEAYRTLIRLAPNAEEAYWAREKLAEIAHHHLRDLPEAITHWQVLATSGREGSEQFAYRVARAYFEARDYEQSRKECEN